MAPVPYTVQGFLVYGFVYGGVVFRMVCTPARRANCAGEGCELVPQFGARLAMTQKPSTPDHEVRVLDPDLGSESLIESLTGEPSKSRIVNRSVLHQRVVSRPAPRYLCCVQ